MSHCVQLDVELSETKVMLDSRTHEVEAYNKQLKEATDKMRKMAGTIEQLKQGLVEAARRGANAEEVCLMTCCNWLIDCFPC